MPDRDTRTLILEAARGMVSATGGAALRVDSVAAAAGVNKRMIYHHFGSREGLLDAVYAASTRAFQDAASGQSEALRLLLWRVLEGRAQGPAGADLRAAWGAQMGLIDEHDRERHAAAFTLRLGRALLGDVFAETVDTSGWEGNQEAVLAHLASWHEPTPRKPRVRMAAESSPAFRR